MNSTQQDAQQLRQGLVLTLPSQKAPIHRVYGNYGRLILIFGRGDSMRCKGGRV
jgi:hypothetical protein